LPITGIPSNRAEEWRKPPLGSAFGLGLYQKPSGADVTVMLDRVDWEEQA
jgi:hypothetical protein